MQTLQFDLGNLADGDLVVASLVVVSSINEDGSLSFSVVARGDAPMTTYLGLTVVAQQEILKWGKDA
jgi:hypothetical protein